MQDLANEERMFALLDSLPGLSIVSVGHRPSLIPFHDTKLVLANKGFKVESTGSTRKRHPTTESVSGGGPAVTGVVDSAATGRR